MVSCQKDNSLSSNAPEASKINQVSEMEMKAYMDFAMRPESERQELFQRFDLLTKGKGKALSQDPDLMEAFIALEGVTNADFSVDWEDFGEIVEEEVSIDLSFYETDSGLYVSSSDFITAYNELHSQVSDLVDIDSGDAVLLLDLSLGEFNESSQTVALNGTAAIAPIFNQWYSPSTAYWAALGAGGWATPNTPNVTGLDGASYLRGYANGTASWRSRCPNGVYAIPIPPLRTWDWWLNSHLDLNKLNLFNLQVTSNSWRNNTNQCIGMDNIDWQYWYSKMDPIIEFGESEYQDEFNNPNIEFHFTDWHSHYQGAFNSGIPSQFVGYHNHISENFFHAGILYYGVLTCRP